MSENSNDSAPERRATHIEPEQPSAVVPPLVPRAGWYPDPSNPAGQRYWDGAQWTEHAAVPIAEGALAADNAPTVAMMPVPASAGLPAAVPSFVGGAGGGAIAASVSRRVPKLKWWQWVLIGFAVIVLVSIIVNGANGERASSDARPAAPAASSDSAEEPRKPAETPTEEPVAMVDMPHLVGSTIAEARAKLESVGLVLAPTDAGDDWIVTAQQPAQGSHPLEGIELSLTSEAPKPVYTLAQQNAIGSAQDYLAYSGFSRGSLIGQLEYEGFSTEDATFGADNAGADWNAEAAESAQSYLDYSSFSRDGLYGQLEYEKFTPEQIEFALAAVGY